MENVVAFPKRPARPRPVPIRTDEDCANVANMAQAAVANIAKLQAANEATHEKIRLMTQAAEAARTALRQLHFLAVAYNERAWALRVVQVEADAIKDGIERGDA